MVFGIQRTAQDHLKDAQRARQSRRPVDALVAFGRALALEPDLRPALMGKANALVEAGREREALPIYDQLMAADDADPLAHFNKGVALSNLYRMMFIPAAPNAPFEDAIACFQAAHQRGHKRANALLFILSKLSTIKAGPEMDGRESQPGIVLVPED
jgi:tetratricopeptide (TPR) repeat protein